jgi:hypothetical protein
VKILVTLAAACATGAVVLAQSNNVEVRTSLDRTAVWVADRVTYTITIACRKGIDILADDLSKDKLQVEGLEVLRSDSGRTIDRDDRTTYTFSYELTTFRVDLAELKIAPLAVRYYVKRAGQRIGDTAPAGEVRVPAAVIAFRSALPDGQDTYAIRDGRAARARNAGYAWLEPVGIGLVLISLVPAAVAVMAVVRRARSREKRRSARQVRHDERASLDALQAINISTLAGRREAYSQLNALVRDHVHRIAGLEASSLTPGEIKAALSRPDARVPTDLVAAVLGACDQARYAPPDALPSADACRQAIEQAETLLGS